MSVPFISPLKFILRCSHPQQSEYSGTRMSCVCPAALHMLCPGSRESESFFLLSKCRPPLVLSDSTPALPIPLLGWTSFPSVSSHCSCTACPTPYQFTSCLIHFSIYCPPPSPQRSLDVWLLFLCFWCFADAFRMNECEGGRKEGRETGERKKQRRRERARKWVIGFVKWRP